MVAELDDRLTDPLPEDVSEGATDESIDEEEEGGELSFQTILGFSLGHVFNDMAASMWFTYFLIYFEKVLMMRNWRAGMLMLIGQVADAVSTSAIGYISDRRLFLPTAAYRYGQYIPWHFVGFVLVFFSFPFLFNRCLVCFNHNELIENLYYIPFIVVFQIGWASMQVNHLSLINRLTPSKVYRRTLVNARLAASVISNLIVYFLLLYFFSGDRDSVILPTDAGHFRSLAFFVVGIGFVATVIFYALTKEPLLDQITVTNESDSNNARRLFKTSDFYLCGLLYLSVRLYYNLSQVYFPMYITMTLQLPKHFLSISPLIIYISGFIVFTLLTSSLVQKHVADRFIVLLIGCFIGFINCTLLYIPLPYWIVYAESVFLGLAQSLLLSTSFSFIESFIRNQSVGTAFVYGCMGFADKVVNGLFYQGIEIINPNCHFLINGAKCSVFYRNILVYVPGGCLLLLVIVAIFCIFKRKFM